MSGLHQVDCCHVGRRQGPECTLHKSMTVLQQKVCFRVSFGGRALRCGEQPNM